MSERPYSAVSSTRSGKRDGTRDLLQLNGTTFRGCIAPHGFLPAAMLSSALARASAWADRLASAWQTHGPLGSCACWLLSCGLFVRRPRRPCVDGEPPQLQREAFDTLPEANGAFRTVAAALQHDPATQRLGLSPPGTGGVAAPCVRFGYASANARGWSIGGQNPNLKNWRHSWGQANSGCPSNHSVT